MTHKPEPRRPGSPNQDIEIDGERRYRPNANRVAAQLERLDLNGRGRAAREGRRCTA
jgi:hypothetical protein